MNIESQTIRRPSARRAFATIYRLVLGQIWSRGRLLVVAALSLTIVALGLVVRRAGETSERVEDGTQLVSSLGLGLVLPVIALVFATATLGDIREDKTLVYLWLTPLAPWVVPVAAFAASVTIVLPAVLLPILVAAALVTTGGGLLAGTAAAVVLGTLAYCAVFTTAGLLLRRTLVAGVLYVLIWEGFVASAGAGVARFAIRAHTRSILSNATDVEINLGDLSPTSAVVILAAIIGGALLVGVRRYQTMTVD